MEQQPEQQLEAQDEEMSLPALSIFQAKIDNELLKLFNSDDASKSSFFNSTRSWYSLEESKEWLVPLSTKNFYKSSVWSSASYLV